MNARTNGAMIAVAREEQGMTQSSLASRVGVSQGRLSRFESGLSVPPDDVLRRIALELRRPTTFFSWNDTVYSPSCLYHRKRTAISVTTLRTIHARVNILRMQASRLLELAEIKCNYSFHRLNMEQLGGPEQVASRCRQLWQIPTGPIRDLTFLIERAGGVIFSLEFGGAKVDGISQWPLDAPGLPPVFFVNSRTPGDRMRWTLAHEVGHILIHHLPTDDPENEADRFASELLMPASEIADELREMTLKKAINLKAYWRVSMQAIIRRAFSLSKIDRERYTHLCKELARKGYRTCEPLPIPREEPRMLRELINVHRRVSGRNIAELSEHLGLLEDDFVEQYWRDCTSLRLVV